MILRVGLTGGIASGKSTILRNFAALGCITADADAIVANLYRPGNAGHTAIINMYGNVVRSVDGTIDRKQLAALAFSSPEEARKLNALIHPLVIAEQERRMSAEEVRGDDAIYIIEATLLLESGGKQRYDRIVVVDVDPAVQIERGVERGLPREEVERRIAHQMPREERLRQADYIVDNGGDRAAGERETRRVHELLLRDLAEKKKRASL